MLINSASLNIMKRISGRKPNLIGRMKMINNYEWSFYALNQKNKLVLGFTDNNDAKEYCRKYNFKLFTRNGLKNKKINPAIIDNWVCDNEAPEYNYQQE